MEEQTGVICVSAKNSQVSLEQPKAENGGQSY